MSYDYGFEDEPIYDEEFEIPIENEEEGYAEDDFGEENSDIEEE